MSLLKAEKKALIYIFLYYTVTQGLILFVSGLWFDDWCLMNISNSGLLQWGLEMGKPDILPIFILVRDFPDMFYKSVIFLAYYIVAVSFYLMIREIFKMDMGNALMLCFLYLCIPVNDIRIMRAGLPYTLGLMLWFLAFCILVYKYTDLKIGYRILTLVLFFFSFILNSLLVFYGLVLLYIILKEKNFKRVLLKADFFIIPFVFFLGKQIIFPAHGVYTSYNQVSIGSMFDGIRGVFYAFSTIFREILHIFIDPISSLRGVFVISVLVMSIFAVFIFGNTKYSVLVSDSGAEKKNIRTVVAEFSIGLLAALAGLYPYVVTGGSVVVATGFDGRDSILVPFGVAMIIDSVLKLLCKKAGRIVIIAAFMVVGIMHFTKWYSTYQGLYYWDRGLQEYLSMNSDLENVKVVYFRGDGTKGNGMGWNYGMVYYQYNGIFEEVFGDESRLVADNSNELLSIKENQMIIDREWYNMTEFNMDHTGIDAVIVYSNNIGLKKALSIRFSEILGHDIGSKLIEEASFSVFLPEDEEFSAYVTF